MIKRRFSHDSATIDGPFEDDWATIAHDWRMIRSRLRTNHGSNHP